jgi:hypothetical protein
MLSIPSRGRVRKASSTVGGFTGAAVGSVGVSSSGSLAGAAVLVVSIAGRKLASKASTHCAAGIVSRGAPEVDQNLEGLFRERVVREHFDVLRFLRSLRRLRWPRRFAVGLRIYSVALPHQDSALGQQDFLDQHERAAAQDAGYGRAAFAMIADGVSVFVPGRHLDAAAERQPIELLRGEQQKLIWPFRRR